MVPLTMSYCLIETNNVEPLGSRKVDVDPWDHLQIALVPRLFWASCFSSGMVDSSASISPKLPESSRIHHENGWKASVTLNEAFDSSGCAHDNSIMIDSCFAMEHADLQVPVLQNNTRHLSTKQSFANNILNYLRVIDCIFGAA
jgi:hypothetical protein